MIANAEGTELTLLPRLEEDEKEAAVVEVVRPPSAETLALVERVFQRASSDDVAGEKASTTRDQLVTAAESQGPHSTNAYLAQNCSYRDHRHGTFCGTAPHSYFVELHIGWRVRP